MQNRMRRQFGLLAPVFALRGSDGQGIGDTKAVVETLEFCAYNGIGALQILPINRTGGDNSPYNAVSSMSLEPALLHMAPDWVPGFDEMDSEFVGYPRLSAMLNTNSVVDYPLVKALKGALLWRSFLRFESQQLYTSSILASELQVFKRANSDWLAAYTLFQVLMDKHKTQDFNRWEEAASFEHAERWLAQQPAQKRAEISRKRRFESYVQWVAYRQWRRVKAQANHLGVELIGDMPYGVSHLSADLWGPDRDLFLEGWSGGAPPEPAFVGDMFVVKFGQNWGGAVPNWTKHQQNQYAWWERRIRGLSEYCHRFRLDHALGFFRQWCFPWCPDRDQEFVALTSDQIGEHTGGLFPQFLPRGDDTDENKEQNRKDGKDIISKMVAIANSYETTIIAEDLGVVPPYIRPTLAELRVPGFVIPPWEPLQNGFYRPMSDYPYNCVAAWDTHDHDSLPLAYAKMVERWHSGSEQGRLEIERLMQLLDMDITNPPEDYTLQLHVRLHSALMKSPADLVVSSAPSFLGTKHKFNEPGTKSGCWTARFEHPLSVYGDDPFVGSWLQIFRRFLQQTDRLVSRQK